MQRLKTRPQFQATLAGATVARTPHFALHRLALPAPAPVHAPAGAATPAPLIAPGDIWMGAMVPKRWARRAVTRNAIKRQIFAVADDFAPGLPQAAHVVRLRATFERKQFVSATSPLLKAAVRAELQALFERAQRPAPPARSAA